MALTIGLSASGCVTEGEYAGGLAFEDEAEYWYLFPFFQRLAERTGAMIDLYDDAVFAPEQIPHLLAILAEAAAAAGLEPDQFEVEVGRQEEGPIFEHLAKPHLIGTLEAFTTLAKRALMAGKSVVCFGD